MIAGDSLYLFSTLSRKLMALPGSITCQHEKRLRLCSSFAGVDCDYSDLLTITGLCSARSSDTSEESFGLLRCCCLVTQSCPTLCDLMDCSPASSSVHGILQARIPEWVAIPFSRGCSQPGDQTQVYHTAGRFFII